MDNCYSGESFRAAYDGTIPSIPDKSMWPKKAHGFFMHPPLLKSTAGRRKQNRYKGAAEGGSKGSKGRHQCSFCQQCGHHWYTCKDGDPADIAAMLADRGPPKRKKKKITVATTKTSIVPAAPVQRMVFPVLPTVVDLSKKRKNKSSSSTRAKKQKSISNTSTAEASDPSVRGSGTGSSHLDPLAITFPSGLNELDTIDKSASQQQRKKKRAIAKKLTPNKASPAMSTRSKAPTSPSSPAMGTRSKKKLNL